MVACLCAGCGQPISGNAMTLPDQARICNVDCLVSYGGKWREGVTEALRELGIREWTEDDPSIRYE